MASPKGEPVMTNPTNRQKRPYRSPAQLVAEACSANPVAILVPCHRVIRSDGSLGGYRRGMQRKTSLLANEQSSARNSIG